MQPSSLVFVVVIAIWAAYLVQYWVRRREHLSTARSVDRFSRAMRVLERRSARSQPEADTGPAVRSSLVARPTARSARSATADASGVGAGMPVGPARPPRTPRLGRPVQSGDPRQLRLVRRLRAAGLLLTLAVVPSTIGLAVLGLAPWWSIAVAFGMVGLCLVGLRLVAVREQTARHTERSMRVSGSRSASVGSRSGDAGDMTANQGAADVEAPEWPAAHPAAAPAYRPGDPTWQPVPVPRPTYQLKDPAPPPRAEPNPAPSQPAPEREQVTATPSRRAVGG